MSIATTLAASHIWQTLRDAASAPYRSAGRFAWRFAHGKLGMDPVFRHRPADWAPAPHGARVTGIELMSRDVERARRALEVIDPVAGATA